MICVDSVVYSSEIINMFLVSQVSGLVENLNIGIYSDTINVNLCMMILLIELYQFIPLSVTRPYFKVTVMLNSFK